MNEQNIIRSNIVAEARSWIGTPYHLRARVKGQGADCGSFLAEVLIACGLANRQEIYDGLNVHHDDWWIHAKNEKAYKLRMLRHARKVLEGVCHRSMNAEPGCMLLMQTAGSRIANHGAIVTEWPRIVHCISPCVVEVDITRDPMWRFHRVEVFDPVPIS